ncbi:MAG: TlpA family protein disulfide reductase [Candidatus Reddybacter sp.]
MSRHKMKVLVLLLGFSFLAGCEELVEPHYNLLGGGSLRLTELEGKVVLINYWAEWCRPCRIEIPELNQFAQDHLNSVRVLSVNFDGVEGEQLIEQVAALGIEFDTLLQDPRDALAVPASGGLPETIVLNRRGEVQEVLLGPQTQQSLQAVLSSILPPEFR